MGESKARQLFVVGTSRTGTSALCQYLSMHPEMCVLNERYKNMAEEIGPEHFQFARLRENVQAESKAPAEKFEPVLESKRENELKWIGDKGFSYTKNLETVSENNPGCVFMLALRDPVSVAASFIEKSHRRVEGLTNEEIVEKAINHTNRVLKGARQFINRRPQTPLIIIEYESFFSRPEAYAPLLSGVLGVDMSETVEMWRAENEKFSDIREGKPISEEEAERVKAGVNRAVFNWLTAYGVGQRRAAAAITS